MKKQLIRHFEFFFGILIMSIAFNVILLRNEVPSTGVSGISILMYHLFGIDTSLFVFVANVVLIFISFALLGKRATINTILGSLLYPIFIKLTYPFCQLIDISSVDLLIQVLVAAFLLGYGSGLVYKNGYTTGGTDIIVSILVKYFKIPMNVAIYLTESIIALMSGWFMGIGAMVYTFIILFVTGTLSNKYMLGLYDDKVLFITSNSSKEIQDALLKNYHYGVTMIHGEGGFSDIKKKVIMVSVKKDFYIEIRDMIHKIDKHAFVTVVDSFETDYMNKEGRHHNRKTLEDLMID